MIDRKSAPQILPISDVNFIYPEEWKLSNGLKLWRIKSGSQDVVKIDFIFEAGTWFQNRNLLAGLTNAFLNQGSANFNAQEIAEVFDAHGAYLQCDCDQHFACVSVLTLNKFVETILKVTAEIIQNPIFPEKEIFTQIDKKKQQYIIENSKVKTLAQKCFSQVLFGENHPYSNSNKLSDYDELERQHFVDFHRKYYSPANCKVIVAGNVTDELINSIEKYFGAEEWERSEATTAIVHQISTYSDREYFVEKADALQSAIRIGCLMPNRENPDFHGLNFLVTILGGYFGSRLMTNIREDKGYTYGIGSSVYTMPNAAYLSISTEVGHDVTKQALNEIYAEISRLKNEPVPSDELETVRNYLMGENLRSFDGVFAMSGSLRLLIEAILNYNYFHEMVKVIRTISANDIMRLANQYFNETAMKQVVAGKSY